MNKRLRFLRGIRDFFSFEPSEIPPKWLKFIYYVLFPTHYIIDNQEFLRYDVFGNRFYIFGQKYSEDMMYFLSNQEPNSNLWFRVIKREDGVITLESKIFN